MFTPKNRVIQILSFGIAALMSNVALAAQSNSPIRLKIDTKVLRTLFHKNDQLILDAFQDLEINKESEPDERCPTFKSSQFSLVTDRYVNREDYDLDLSIYEKDREGNISKRN